MSICLKTEMFFFLLNSVIVETNASVKRIRIGDPGNISYYFDAKMLFSKMLKI